MHTVASVVLNESQQTFWDTWIRKNGIAHPNICTVRDCIEAPRSPHVHVFDLFIQSTAASIAGA